jgi:hypothetical protein
MLLAKAERRPTEANLITLVIFELRGARLASGELAEKVGDWTGPWDIFGALGLVMSDASPLLQNGQRDLIPLRGSLRSPKPQDHTRIATRSCRDGAKTWRWPHGN